MLKTLFEQQRILLNRFFDSINLQEVEEVLSRLIKCQGVIALSGVGKSGLIAQKIAATLVSTGTRAIFLSPSNALHGDIGFLGADDLLMLFSKSGSTQELVGLLPYVRKRGVGTIAIVSAAHSKLAQLCDLCVTLPIEKEIDSNNVIPTTSTAAQLIFGDCLAIALMEKKHFGMDQFASNHPGGILGRKIALKVADLMLQGADLPVGSPDDALIDVLHELSKKKCGCLLVVDANRHLQGIFTDGDLRRAIQSQGPDALRLPLSRLMTLAPKSTSPHVIAIEAVRKMEEDPSRLITVLPVVEEGKLVGLLRMHDILQKELS